MNIGIDVGGTFIRAGRIEKNKVLARVKVRTEPEKGRDAVISRILSAASEVFTKACGSAGIGIAGPVDFRKGIVARTPNLPLDDTDISRILRKELGIPVYADNDANCCVLAEAIYGAGKGHDKVAGLTLGTGIGGGLVAGKRIYHGRMNACEFGHMSINLDGRACGCGNTGCLEAYVGKKGLMTMAGSAAKEPLGVYKAAAKGDRKALKAFSRYGRYLGTGIDSIIKCFDPDIFVLQGGISGAYRFFSSSMRKEIRRRELFRSCPVVKGKLGGDAGIIGAAGLPLQCSDIRKI
ncbi:ROK family protein [Candidatus Woesearchaeota archaeon]|nr:ROK family protein [Candidatus Woesearchaeota archaeon]